MSELKFSRDCFALVSPPIDKDAFIEALQDFQVVTPPIQEILADPSRLYLFGTGSFEAEDFQELQGNDGETEY